MSLDDVRGIPMRENAPMTEYTSFRIGGPADLLFRPRSSEQLARIVRWCRQQEKSLFVLGRGTNLLVSDAGIRGVVVLTTEMSEETCSREGECLIVPCGVLLSRLTAHCAREGLDGLTFAHGIPGTLGGAVFMNAGAYGGEMKDVVLSTTYLDATGMVETVGASEHEFGYRSSLFSRHPDRVVLSSTFRLTQGDPTLIAAEMRDILARRNEKQPTDKPSAGSVFKRPEGHFAGGLIESCGLKGFAIGGAQVSEKHAGFIVNRGGATCEDVRHLIAYIQETVNSRCGIQLEPEVKMVGEF